MTISSLCERGVHNHCWEEECTCEECHLTCPTCGGRCKILYGSGQRCASCERELAKKTPFKGYPCDDCGNLGAFRNPHTRDNVYRCTACHAKSGEPLQLPASVGGQVMSGCAHLPLEDPAHQFLKVRGNRYRCHRCHQDYFGVASKVNVVGEAKGA